MRNQLVIQPSLAEAIAWCRRAGVNVDWGKITVGADELAERSDESHRASEPLGSVDRVVIHRSGFSCGNATFFRWYHRVLNGWRDIGYHFVIGNGARGDSIRGVVESGRPLSVRGAHVSGLNDGSVGICLIDNEDHFRSMPPSQVEIRALENAVAYLLDRFGTGCEVVGHGDLARKACPGQAVPLEEVAEVARRRALRVLAREPEARTRDLRHGFRSGALDPRRPTDAIREVVSSGFNRLVYPFHWVESEWEDVTVAKTWVEEAHAHGVELWLYTGPFGTERRSFLGRTAGAEGWLQRGISGEPACYDASLSLVMFCPRSDYVTAHRLPLVMEFVARTGCDGVFLDIPWVMGGGCHCPRCGREEPPRDPLDAAGRQVRDGLERFVLPLRVEFPEVRIAANAAAPGIWDEREVGATPSALSGLFDELVTEWSPSDPAQLEGIRRSIRTVRALAPCTRVSHAYDEAKTGVLLGSLKSLAHEEGVGTWVAGAL